MGGLGFAKDSNFDTIDLGTALPGHGYFDDGVDGWREITSLGIVTSYSASSEGWVGLRCSGGQMAGIECGPINISTSGVSYDWDQFGIVFNYRGKPDSPYNSNLVGKVRLSFYDAATSEIYTTLGFDFSTTVAFGLKANGQSDPLTWGTFTWQFTPPHLNWYQISRIRITYEVPASYTGPATEFQITQFMLVTTFQRETPG